MTDHKIDPVDFVRRYPDALELVHYLDTTRMLLELEREHFEATSAEDPDPHRLKALEAEIYSVLVACEQAWSAMMHPKAERAPR